MDHTPLSKQLKFWIGRDDVPEELSDLLEKAVFEIESAKSEVEFLAREVAKNVIRF